MAMWSRLGAVAALLSLATATPADAQSAAGARPEMAAAGSGLVQKTVYLCRPNWTCNYFAGCFWERYCWWEPDPPKRPRTGRKKAKPRPK